MELLRFRPEDVSLRPERGEPHWEAQGSFGFGEAGQDFVVLLQPLLFSFQVHPVGPMFASTHLFRVLGL
jgi:hypothetical protein